jgi:hypothetical protein
VVSTIALLSVKVAEDEMWATLSDLMLTATVAGAHLSKHFVDGLRVAREQFKSVSIRLVDEAA